MYAMYVYTPNIIIIQLFLRLYTTEYQDMFDEN